MLRLLLRLLLHLLCLLGLLLGLLLLGLVCGGGCVAVLVASGYLYLSACGVRLADCAGLAETETLARLARGRLHTGGLLRRRLYRLQRLLVQVAHRRPDGLRADHRNRRRGRDVLLVERVLLALFELERKSARLLVVKGVLHLQLELQLHLLLLRVHLTRGRLERARLVHLGASGGLERVRAAGHQEGTSGALDQTQTLAQAAGRRGARLRRAHGELLVVVLLLLVLLMVVLVVMLMVVLVVEVLVVLMIRRVVVVRLELSGLLVVEVVLVLRRRRHLVLVVLVELRQQSLVLLVMIMDLLVELVVVEVDRLGGELLLLLLLLVESRLLIVMILRLLLSRRLAAVILLLLSLRLGLSLVVVEQVLLGRRGHLVVRLVVLIGGYIMHLDRCLSLSLTCSGDTTTTLAYLDCQCLAVRIFARAH